ncbi:MAG: DMT family transporter [Spirochaetes bacterium]|nr:DMT family transporter [Spirochaetota bacterium]
MEYFLLLTAALFWGGSFIATRYALTLGGFGVFTLISGRFLISSIILLIITFIKGRERISLKELITFILVGIVYPGLYFLFETTGIARTPAFISSIIIASIPVLTGIFAGIFLKERLSWKGWAGAFLSILGIIVIVLMSGQRGSGNSRPAGFSGSTLTGVLLVFCAAVTGAFYTTSARYFMGKFKPLTLTTIQNVLAFIFFTPAAAVEIGRHGFSVNTGGFAAVVFLGICASALAFLCFNKALSLIEAGKASLFLNVIPIISLVSAWLILGERINYLQGLGGIVVIAGVVFASGKARIKNNPAEVISL